MKLRPLLLASVLLSLPALDAATTVIRGPYLQSATPTSLVVRWRTDNTEGSVVSYGTERGQLTSTAKSEGVGTEHIVQINNLKPDTKYFYAVGGAPLPPPA